MRPEQSDPAIEIQLEIGRTPICETDGATSPMSRARLFFRRLAALLEIGELCDVGFSSRRIR